ncbi:MAG: hypothetical protein ACFFE7_06045 [Candidatus Thorarchaeota archaeon]
MKVRTDSRSIAIFAIFAAMVLAMEVIPVPFLTDIPLGGGFTIDPTGIPVVIVFVGLGIVYSLILVPVIWVAIAYRGKLPGATFKAFAEFYTLLGLFIARLILRKRSYDWKIALPTYVAFGIIFRSIGMFLTNIPLLQIFYGFTPETAVIGSAGYVLLNIFQAIINIVLGIGFFIIIPENLKIEAQLGSHRADRIENYEEISAEELEETNNE